MPGKRRTKAQVKAQRPTAQTTLKDLFHKTSPGTTSDANEQESHSDSVISSFREQHTHPPAQASRSSKPSQLYPIFTKVSSVRERLDAPEIIDITDMSSDTELSTEPPAPSLHQQSSHSSRIRPDGRSGDADTDFPRAGSHGHGHPRKTKTDVEKRSPGAGDAAALPSSYSQHVRGVQHPFTSGQTPLERRASPSFCPSGGGALDFLKNWRLDNTPSTPLARIHRSLAPQQCDEYLRSLSRDHIESHPAFARISVRRDGTSHAEMWTRQFRPRRASEVLGNEDRALYLRDWLRALELHLRDNQPGGPAPDARAREMGTSERVGSRGVKRPRVIRAVTKRGKKKRRVSSDDDLDDFVVFTDEEEERAVDVPAEDSEDELAFCQRTLACLDRRNMNDTLEIHSIASNAPDIEADSAMSQSQQRMQTKFDDNLTNTLLMTGPPGCGKTAAVYACAEELGWEVFEVYPGIGKRNGASLDQLVGDVGKNHIVQTVHRGVRTKTTMVEVKARMGLRGHLVKDVSMETQGAGSEGQPISIDGKSPTDDVQSLPGEVSSEETAISAEADGTRPAIRQSLVLLEEVDVLFKDDGGFWPAVVEFIRCCQRPVVMTCNDVGLVPVAELALQQVLVFEPCPSGVAGSFLQCLALTEGCLVPHEDLMAVYEATHAVDGTERADVPRTEGVAMGDLRRSITQLQMMCAGARHGSTSEMHQGEEAERHVRRSGGPISAGCRDGGMGRRVESELWREMKEGSEVKSHVDAELCRMRVGTGEVSSEEMGYIVVLEGEEGRDVYGRDELIAEEAIRCSRGVHEETGTGPMEGAINPAAGVAREGQLRARVGYRSRMADALGDVLEGTAAVMGQRRAYLDYIPWVREMVRVEDVREGAEEGGGGRWTRNSVRRMRWLGVGEEGRRALRGTGLGSVHVT